MASPIGQVGSLGITTDAEGSRVTIRVSESPGIISEGLSLSTWGAAFVLANNLWKIDVPAPDLASTRSGDSLSNPFVLELGAGTGVVGLTAAILWSAHVVLTDLPLILPGVAANISLNSQLLAKHGGLASCGSLDWCTPDRFDLRSPAGSPYSVRPGGSNKPSVILAADTIYSEEHPELLTRTITTWLARTPLAMVISCYPLRMAYIDHIRDFWLRMEAAGLECVMEDREDGIEEWNEVASTPFEWCVWKWKEPQDWLPVDVE